MSIWIWSEGDGSIFSLFFFFFFFVFYLYFSRESVLDSGDQILRTAWFRWFRRPRDQWFLDSRSSEIFCSPEPYHLINFWFLDTPFPSDCSPNYPRFSDIFLVSPAFFCVFLNFHTSKRHLEMLKNDGVWREFEIFRKCSYWVWKD